MTTAMIMAASAMPVYATDAAAESEPKTQQEQPAEQSSEKTPDPEPDPAPEPDPTPDPDPTPSGDSGASDNSSSGSGSSQASDGTSDTSSKAGTDSSSSGTAASTSSAAASASNAGAAASAGSSSSSSETASSENSSSSSSKAEEKEKEPEEEKEVEEADKHTGTNEQLVSEQNIQDVDVPAFNSDFRFYAADSKDTQALAAKDNVTVYEQTNTDAKKVGTLRKCASATKLKDAKDGWIFIESGEVRGFAKSEWFYTGDEAAKQQETYENGYIAAKKSAAANDIVSENAPADTLHPLNLVNAEQFFSAKIEEAKKEASDEAKKYLEDSKYGTALVSPAENGAYTYTRTTTQKHVTDKVPAFAKDNISIYEDKSDSAEKAGTLDKDALCYVIESDGDWTYVESADVRGFVKTSSITTGDDAKNIYNGKKESDFAVAKQLVKPSENKATYYSIVSVKEGTKTSSVREAMVKMALSCAGRPYVWGGTSLTNGADCSGFVQTIYKSFGINLPRVADAQSRVGTQIKVSDAAPGDLIFFARNGYVYHVAMYAGDGKTIEAYSSKAGIGVHSLSGRPAVWACRILKD